MPHKLDRARVVTQEAGNSQKVKLAHRWQKKQVVQARLQRVQQPRARVRKIQDPPAAIEIRRPIKPPLERLVPAPIGPRIWSTEGTALLPQPLSVQIARMRISANRPQPMSSTGA